MTQKQCAKRKKRPKDVPGSSKTYRKQLRAQKNAAWHHRNGATRSKSPLKWVKSSGRAERMACCFSCGFCRILFKNEALRVLKSGVFWCVFCENFKICVLLISIFWHFSLAPCFLAWFLAIFWAFFRKYYYFCSLDFYEVCTLFTKSKTNRCVGNLTSF